MPTKTAVSTKVNPYKKRKMTYPPMGVNAALTGKVLNSDDNIGNEEADGQEHAEQHDSESGAGSDQANDGVLVVVLDDQDQLDGGEDPPGITKN